MKSKQRGPKRGQQRRTKRGQKRTELGAIEVMALVSKADERIIWNTGVLSFSIISRMQTVFCLDKK